MKLPTTTSRPVMNPPADQAEAGNRTNTAPRQADPDAPGRGETGVSSGSEARPVTATEHWNSNPWGDSSGIPDRVTFHPLGFRDVMWCPYLNEPAILEWRKNKPHCPNCDGNFEPQTHPFICHIQKVSQLTAVAPTPGRVLRLDRAEAEFIVDAAEQTRIPQWMLLAAEIRRLWGMGAFPAGAVPAEEPSEEQLKL